MTAPVISALPDAPSRADPVGFNSAAESFVAALSTFRDEANSLGAYLNGYQVEQSGDLSWGDGDLFVDVSAGYLATLSTDANGVELPGSGNSQGQIILKAGTANRTLLLNTDTDGITYDASYTNTGVGLDHVFKTGGTEVLRIDNNGKIGVGGVTPLDDLHLYSAFPALRFEDADTNDYAQIYSNSGNLILRADVGDTQAGSGIRFDVDGTERARIDASGRLLVGATAADSLLHIEGVGVVADLNRTGSYGTALRLQKDGVDNLLFQVNSNGATVESHGLVKFNVSGGDQAFTLQSDKTAVFEHVVELASIDVASAPVAPGSHTAGIFYCPDGDAGAPCLAVSDGSNWLRVSLGAAISAT